ncbi:hypothetical protein STCU_04499 [Strigomonas culicis]|uniref:C3H1-type domain-containing protein n=1 Tax=Strigomonas culicis TaxID=28005 RepID=S9UFC9_9TRYP|nr:hypothetical protein STCU_04499 [Strigomonas culicis]|eukprot:EPY29522.1 hypothetical protein STCU_04499 [Strigomonas culicis]
MTSAPFLQIDGQIFTLLKNDGSIWSHPSLPMLWNPDLAPANGVVPQTVCIDDGTSRQRARITNTGNASLNSSGSLFTVVVGQNAAASPSSTLNDGATPYSSDAQSRPLGFHTGPLGTFTNTPVVSRTTPSANSSGSTAKSGSQTLNQHPPNDPNQWGFAIADRLHTYLPRIPVPPSTICEVTQGIASYINDVVQSSKQPCSSSVCLLFSENGFCAAGRHCPSFHVSPDYLRLSRALSQPLCCGLHNCYYTQEMVLAKCAPHLLSQTYYLSLDGANYRHLAESPKVEISLLHLSLTVGLDTLPLKDGRRKISQRRRVCSLFLEGKCKWTKDCANIHICHSLYKLLQVENVLEFLKAVQRGKESSQQIYNRIVQCSHVQEYVQSVAMLPLMAQLIVNSHIAPLTALLRFGVAVTSDQKDVLVHLGLVSDDTKLFVYCVSPKVRSMLCPRVM